MPLAFHELIKDINKTDLDDICSSWQWCLTGQKAVALISCAGDLFLIGDDETINWLDTSLGQITKIANNLDQFAHLLEDESNLNNWFLAPMVESLILRGKTLQENEVYSYKILPSLGGTYSIDNMEVTDMSVHFNITGQLQEQIKDLPDGTSINKINFIPKK